MEYVGDRKIINLGCGFRKLIGGINVDSEEVCNPDVVHNLNVFPWPFDDEFADAIFAIHVFEHLVDWWGAFKECSRILKVGGSLEIRVPDASADTANTYRDHLHVFALRSFHGAFLESREPMRSGTNAWAHGQEMTVPLMFKDMAKVPYVEYMWMMRWPFKWILNFCSNHMRNFIWEQVFIFEKIDREVKDGS
jgi:SAM-dependent methyltransferase